MQAEEMMKWSKFYSEIMKNKVPFDPKPVPGLSTDKDEYLAIISPDNEMAFFTRRMQVQSKDQVFHSDRLTEIFSTAKRGKNGNFDA